MSIRYTLFIIYVMLPLLAFPGSNKEIEQLFRRCEQARSLSQYQQLENYSQQLIVLAGEKKDERSLTYAHFYNGLAELFNGKTEASVENLGKAEELAINTGNDSVRALVLNVFGIYHAMTQNNNFVAQQYFFRSLELAEKTDFTELSYRIRGNLLTLSHSMGDSLALANATEVYEYGMSNDNMEQAAMGAYFLSEYYYEHEKYDETEKYIKAALDIYRRYPYEDISSIYTLYAKMLISKGDTDEAEKMLAKAMDMVQKYGQVALRVDVNITYAELFIERKDYRQSAERLQMAIEEADSLGITNKVADCNRLMASNYVAMGRPEKAVEYLQKANELLRNQATINMERLSHEQRIMHDIEQRELDARLKQEEIASQRTMLILMAVILAALLALLLVLVTFYRRRNALYKKIVLQNSRAMARQRELQEQIGYLRNELSKKQTEQPESAISSEKESFALGDEKIDHLYAELCRLMETEHLYTEAQLTREKVAERLGTNRTYLTKVIKEKTNMNYLQYINSYRINEAIRILSDKNQIDYPLKCIWSDLGFSSPSTFYKLFQQAVGITPTTYRKQFLEVNSEVAEDSDDNIV